MHRKMNGRTSTSFLRPTINVVHQTQIVFIQKRDTYRRDNIENIRLALHLALNTCCDKGIQSNNL